MLQSSAAGVEQLWVDCGGKRIMMEDDDPLPPGSQIFLVHQALETYSELSLTMNTMIIIFILIWQYLK